MQLERTLDLFFFQQYEWLRNKISAQAYGLNGSLLTGVNEWQRGSKREETGQEKEGSRGGWFEMKHAVIHTHVRANSLTVGILFLVHIFINLLD